jgi:hypothetical protein
MHRGEKVATFHAKRVVHMVTFGARVFAFVAALLVGVIFVLTVRTAGLHEVAARANCAQADTVDQACH